jgi:hypothetical protein
VQSDADRGDRIAVTARGSTNADPLSHTRPRFFVTSANRSSQAGDGGAMRRGFFLIFAVCAACGGQVTPSPGSTGGPTRGTTSTGDSSSSSGSSGSDSSGTSANGATDSTSSNATGNGPATKSACSLSLEGALNASNQKAQGEAFIQDGSANVYCGFVGADGTPYSFSARLLLPSAPGAVAAQGAQAYSTADGPWYTSMNDCTFDATVVDPRVQGELAGTFACELLAPSGDPVEAKGAFDLTLQPPPK